MKKSLLIVISMTVLMLAVPPPAMAEAVVGCPLGLEEGVFWFRSQVGWLKADEALWNPDSHGDTPRMVSLPEGWKSQIFNTKYRFGYGITDRFDIGFSLHYKYKDIKREVWKKEGNEWVKKWKEIKDSGLAETWVAAKYKLIQEQGNVEAIAIGVGYKPDTSGADNVRNTIGTGTNDLKVVGLLHNKLGSSGIHLCSHLSYQFRSRVRDIDNFKKSGWQLGGKTSYKINFEYGLNKSETLLLNLKFTGFRKAGDRKPDGTKVVNSGSYEDAVVATFAYFPYGAEKCEHRRAMIGLKFPYNVKTGFSADIIPSFTFMWVW